MWVCGFSYSAVGDFRRASAMKASKRRRISACCSGLRASNSLRRCSATSSLMLCHSASLATRPPMWVCGFPTLWLSTPGGSWSRHLLSWCPHRAPYDEQRCEARRGDQHLAEPCARQARSSCCQVETRRRRCHRECRVVGSVSLVPHTHVTTDPHVWECGLGLGDLRYSMSEVGVSESGRRCSGDAFGCGFGSANYGGIGNRKGDAVAEYLAKLFEGLFLNGLAPVVLRRYHEIRFSHASLLNRRFEIHWRESCHDEEDVSNRCGLPGVFMGARWRVYHHVSRVIEGFQTCFGRFSKRPDGITSPPVRRRLRIGVDDLCGVTEINERVGEPKCRCRLSGAALCCCNCYEYHEPTLVGRRLHG